MLSHIEAHDTGLFTESQYEIQTYNISNTVKMKSTVQNQLQVLSILMTLPKILTFVDENHGHHFLHWETEHVNEFLQK